MTGSRWACTARFTPSRWSLVIPKPCSAIPARRVIAKPAMVENPGEPRIYASRQFFFIPSSFFMESLDMLSLDIESFDMLSFFMLSLDIVSFFMLSFFMSSAAKAAGASATPSETTAAENSARRVRLVMMAGPFVVWLWQATDAALLLDAGATALVTPPPNKSLPKSHLVRRWGA